MYTYKRQENKIKQKRKKQESKIKQKMCKETEKSSGKFKTIP
jgi:hypothetical protein